MAVVRAGSNMSLTEGSSVDGQGVASVHSVTADPATSATRWRNSRRCIPVSRA